MVVEMVVGAGVIRVMLLCIVALPASACGSGAGAPASPRPKVSPCPGLPGLSTTRRGTSASYSQARDVLDGHRDQLMVRCRGANGTGVGLADPADRTAGYAIVVFLREPSDVPARSEGWALRRVPLRFRVVGDISALPAS
jgi:hypothetical protein